MSLNRQQNNKLPYLKSDKAINLCPKFHYIPRMKSTLGKTWTPHLIDKRVSRKNLRSAIKIPQTC